MHDDGETADAFDDEALTEAAWHAAVEAVFGRGSWGDDDEDDGDQEEQD